MKQNLLLLAVVILMTAFTQGWASTIDSLRIHQNSDDFTCTWNGFGLRDSLKYTDGLIPDDRLPNDGLSVIDFITPSGTAETNASAAEHKLWISYPSNAKVTFSDVLYLDNAIFIIKSEHVKKYTLTITGDDKDSFTLDSYNIYLGGLTNWNSRVIQQAVTITFRPKRAGTHKAQVIIKEKSGKATCTLTVEGTAIPFITTNALNLYFDPQHKTRKFKLWGTHLTGPVYLTAGSGYSVSPTYIPASKAMAPEGVEVTVTCRTTKVGETKLTIRSTGAWNDYVYLHYSSGSTNAPSLDLEPNEPVVTVENGTEFYSSEPWNNGTAGLDELTQAVKIYADGQSIIIESPVAQSAIVSDIAGHAQSVNLQEGRNVIPASGNGIHIVKVGEKTVKLLLR